MGANSQCEVNYTADDGTAENYFYVRDTTSNGGFVQRLQPFSYPFDLASVRIGWTRGEGPTTAFDYRIVVFDDDGVGGLPGAKLLEIPTHASGLPAWPTVNFTTTTVPSGSSVVLGGAVFVGAFWDGLDFDPWWNRSGLERCDAGSRHLLLRRWRRILARGTGRAGESPVYPILWGVTVPGRQGLTYFPENWIRDNERLYSKNLPESGAQGLPASRVHRSPTPTDH